MSIFRRLFQSKTSSPRRQKQHQEALQEQQQEHPAQPPLQAPGTDARGHHGSASSPGSDGDTAGGGTPNPARRGSSASQASFGSAVSNTSTDTTGTTASLADAASQIEHPGPGILLQLPALRRLSTCLFDTLASAKDFLRFDGYALLAHLLTAGRRDEQWSAETFQVLLDLISVEELSQLSESRRTRVLSRRSAQKKSTFVPWIGGTGLVLLSALWHRSVSHVSMESLPVRERSCRTDAHSMACRTSPTFVCLHVSRHVAARCHCAFVQSAGRYCYGGCPELPCGFLRRTERSRRFVPPRRVHLELCVCSHPGGFGCWVSLHAVCARVRFLVWYSVWG